MAENKEHTDEERDSKQRCLSQMYNSDTLHISIQIMVWYHLHHNISNN